LAKVLYFSLMRQDQMNIQAERTRLAAWVLQLEDEDFLRMVARIAEEFMPALSPEEMRLQDLKAQLAQAEAEAAAGLGFSTEEMLQEVDRW
jgi:hypothetical protein